MIKIETIASGSSGNAYRISDGKTAPLLLECGISFRELQKALNFQVSELAGVLISHSHQDHCKAVSDLIKAGIDCYMIQETADQLKLSGHRLKIIESAFTVGTWNVVTFPIVHDVPGVGFYMANQDGEKLLYVSDSSYIHERFAGMTYIMVEANYSLDILNENIKSGVIPPEMKRRLIRTHSGLHNVIEFLKANDLKSVKEIHLIHISENNGDPAMFRKEVQKATGKIVILPPG